MGLFEKITRKKFIRILGNVLIFPIMYFWISGVRRHQSIDSSSKDLILPLDLPPGVSFRDPVIIFNKAGGFTVFSARCTHLGCMINHFENEQFVCPCHGSVFTTEGKSLKGPALKSLKKYNYSIDSENGKIIIHIS